MCSKNDDVARPRISVGCPNIDPFLELGSGLSMIVACRSIAGRGFFPGRIDSRDSSPRVPSKGHQQRPETYQMAW